MRFLRAEDNAAVFEIGSGSYTLEATIAEMLDQPVPGDGDGDGAGHSARGGKADSSLRSE